jgi:hypothetical protein
MEFVTVTFPRVRDVQMDGAPEGKTGDLIGVQRGHHIFDLGVPLDYTPPNRTEVVAGTSQDRPMIIEFEPAPIVEMATRPRSAARPPAPAGARTTRTRGRKKAAKKQKAARTKAGKKKTGKKKTGKKKIGRKR